MYGSRSLHFLWRFVSRSIVDAVFGNAVKLDVKD